MGKFALVIGHGKPPKMTFAIFSALKTLLDHSRPHTCKNDQASQSSKLRSSLAMRRTKEISNEVVWIIQKHWSTIIVCLNSDPFGISTTQLFFDFTFVPFLWTIFNFSQYTLTFNVVVCVSFLSIYSQADCT